MIGRVLWFVRLPYLMLLIFAVGRFWLGAASVPYEPRGNAIFSIVGLSFISAVYFGALSRSVGGFKWGGTLLVGYSIGLWGQALIFVATWISFAANIDGSFFRHWDALNLPPGTIAPMAKAMGIRAQGLLVGPIAVTVATTIGRLLSFLAPQPE
jgi:hypothetical protein